MFKAKLSQNFRRGTFEHFARERKARTHWTEYKCRKISLEVQDFFSGIHPDAVGWI